MVKVKKNKRLQSERNKNKADRRWSKKVGLGLANNISDVTSEFTGVESLIRPGTSDVLSSEKELEDQCRPSKPTGFALYDSYKPHVNIENNSGEYIFVNTNKLINFLSSFPCRECLYHSLEVKLEVTKGFAHTFSLVCTACGNENLFQTSDRLSSKESKRAAFDVNRRVVKAFTSMGKGHRAIEMFCLAMEMKPMQFLSYNKHVIALKNAYKDEVNKSLVEARNEVRKCYGDLNDDQKVLDITVSYDGTWQKRGFTSKYGVGCCIEVITGLVIDFEILSKYCKRCQQMKIKTKGNKEAFDAWFEVHRPMCQCNYVGSSPAMEVTAAERLWARSESLGFRYTTLVSDGDAKTQDHLNELEPYPGVQIEKVECLNHVAKRLGTGLRNLVKKYVGSDEKMGGKGRGKLSEPVIQKLTRYYRNGITKNLGDVNKMKKSIFATLLHCQSTDKKPQHNNCPTGEQSWCFYQRAKAKKIDPESHNTAVKTPLTEENVRKMMPLYQRLSSDCLLERCIAGRTNNANEALHNIIWTKCPKTTFTSKVKIDIGVCEAISIYNTGYLKTSASYQNAAGISPGRYAAKISKLFDKKRLRLSRARNSEKYEVYRRRMRLAQKEEEERLQGKEGLTYGAGCF